MGELLDMPTKAIAQIVKHAIVHITPMDGDPGDLRKWSKIMRSFTLNYECGTDFQTTSYNDLSLPDLHRPDVLNYIEPNEDVQWRGSVAIFNRDVQWRLSMDIFNVDVQCRCSMEMFNGDFEWRCSKGNVNGDVPWRITIKVVD